MKFIVICLFLGGLMLAQSPHPARPEDRKVVPFIPGVPTLSTADKVAIGALEQQKRTAQNQFNDAQQQEMVILREWKQLHPLYHIDEQTFEVKADVKP
jgi:hypothetical protein